MVRTEVAPERAMGGRTSAARDGLERYTGPLSPFLKRVLFAGGLAAFISLGLTTFALVVYESLLPGSHDLGHDFGLLMVIGIVAGHLMPAQVVFNATVPGLPGGGQFISSQARAPLNSLTILALLAAGYGGYRSGRKGEMSWPAGLAAAVVYATVITFLGVILEQYAETSALNQLPLSLTNITNIIVTISPALPAAWFYALLIAVPASLIGAAIRGNDFYRLANRAGWQSWHAPIMGAIIASLICFIVEFLLLFCYVLVAGDAGEFPLSILTPLAGGSGNSLLDYLISAPLWTTSLLGLSVGASMRASVHAPHHLSESTHQFAVGLTTAGPYPQWWYILPLLPLTACILGAFLSVRLSRQYRAAFAMALPFAAINLLIAFLARITYQVTVADDAQHQVVGLSSLLSTALGSLDGVTGALGLNLTVTTSLGLDLVEMVVGSVLVALAGAAIAALFALVWQYFGLIGPAGPHVPLVRAPTPAPSPSRRRSGSGGDAFPGGVGSPTRPTPRPSPQPASRSTYTETPGYRDDTSARPRSTPSSRTSAGQAQRGSRIPLDSVTAAPGSQHARTVCPQCGKVSSGLSRCPSCSAPLNGK